MKIFVVCQYYYPENFQINDICEQLVADGHSVTVLTGLPNYPTGVIPEEYRKGQKRDEMVNGVRVLRCSEIPRSKGAIGLAKNYLSYCLSASFKAKRINEDFDVVFVYQPSPVLMAIPAIKYVKRSKKPMMLYCCDLWPESMKTMKTVIKSERNPAFRLIRRISSSIYSACDLILLQSETFIPYMERVHHVPAEKMEYLPAFAKDSYLEEDFSTDDDRVDFVFLGNIGIAQNVEGIIDAVAQLKDLNGFLLHIVGDGSSLASVKRRVEEKGLSDKVRFYGRRPVDEMPEFYKLADVCLVSLNSENLTGLTLPSKVQGYMAAGKPIIGMIDGSAQMVIRESGCGLCVPAGDTDGLSAAMREFIIHKEQYAACGENGRDYFIKHFKKEIFMEKFYEALNKVR